jgi:hypothetical protein
VVEATLVATVYVSIRIQIQTIVPRAVSTVIKHCPPTTRCVSEDHAQMPTSITSTVVVQAMYAELDRYVVQQDVLILSPMTIIVVHVAMTVCRLSVLVANAPVAFVSISPTT